MTIGDVLAAVAIIVGLGLSGWALLVGLALIFTRFAAQAQGHLENGPAAAFSVGLALVATVGLGAVALLSAPNGLLKLVGWLLLLVLIALSAQGGPTLTLAKPGLQQVELRIPATAGKQMIEVNLAGKSWSPHRVRPVDNDNRELGVRVFSLEMIAASAPQGIGTALN